MNEIGLRRTYAAARGIFIFILIRGRCHNAEKLVAWIIDTHVTTPGKLLMGVVDIASALERAVSALNSLDPLPDLTVITGDLVERGDVEEYDHWRTLVAPLQMPALAIPGNHDAREHARGVCRERLTAPSRAVLQPDEIEVRLLTRGILNDR